MNLIDLTGHKKGLARTMLQSTIQRRISGLCLSLASLFLVNLDAAAASDSKLIDEAAMFSTTAVQDAQLSLKKVDLKSRLPITIQTRRSADGQAPDKLAINLAKSNAGEGLYLLILKDDRKIEMLWSGIFKSRITNADRDQVRKSISDEFKKSNYDAGLKQGIEHLVAIAERFPIGEAVPAKVKPQPGTRLTNTAPQTVTPRNQGGSSLMTLILLGLGIVILVSVVRSFLGGRSYGGGGTALGRGPGYGGGGGGYGGGPGYGGGGGGGGFFSGMLGGLGGAVLGNWAYDKLSGHGHSDHSTELGQGSESAGVWSGSSGEEPVADAGQWSGADDGGDWGRQEDSGGWSGADTGGDWSGGDSGGGDSGGGGGDW